ncbi:putative peptidoglycan-binding LysM protein [uncultured Caudovirales phage]|uniref:Putative peptidoglycan-binding LysM protein n=1 Tax=uncultured Caudovirales phage TaxID=2100421 RepID=A0A2H4J2N2_9CAUD|nr:putative peptidoglycan-binding LysM protein [uncultured Caudovirales phage]
MSVEFWLSYNNNAESMRLPVNPNGISVTSPFGITDVEVTHIGEFSVFGERGLKEFTFSSFFPREYHPSYCEFMRISKAPVYVKKLEEWRDKKRPIRLVVTGTSINFPVTIRDFSLDYEKGGEMGDIYYSLTLKEYRWQKARESVDTVTAKAPTKSEQKAAERPEKINKEKQTNKTYTVKSGDSLSKVFGKDWRKVYEANKSVIGANPNLIKPGQKLVIP